MGLQRIILNICQLTSAEAMSSYEGRFVKTGVVFDALYFKNEVGDPPIFFSISDIGNSLYDCSQSMKKICIVEVFRANVLNLNRCHHFNLTSKMGFCEHRAAKIIAEFDDARAKKLIKNQTSTTQIFYISPTARAFSV